MTQEQKMEHVKKLESLVAFQKDCLNNGDLDTFDRIEDQIKRLEERIVFQA